MYVDRELVKRVEYGAADTAARQADVLARMTPTSPAVAQECDGGQLIAFGTGRYVNRAMGIGLGSMSGAEIVTTVERFYVSRSLPASVEVSPWVNADLIEALAAADFRLERFRNVYVRQLDSLPNSPKTDIREVDAAMMAARNAILADGSLTGKYSNEFFEAMAQLDNTHDFVAISNDVPAACGSLNTVDGVGWLGGAATLNEFRGRGLQQALIVYRLHLARELKCDFAACTAVPDGQSARNLERLGFQLLYTQTVLTKSLDSDVEVGEVLELGVVAEGFDRQCGL